MSLNCVEIEAVVDTLPHNGMIKKFYQTDRGGIIINVFDGKTDEFILAGVNDGCNRICMIPRRANFKKEQMRFSELLNANLQGARLVDVYQHRFSRLVVFKMAIYEKERLLVCRLWGNGGNIILTDEHGMIMDVLRRMPKRDEWPGEYFDPDQFEQGQSPEKFTVRKEFETRNINESIFNFYEKVLNDAALLRKKKELDAFLTRETESIERRIAGLDEKAPGAQEEQYERFGELLKASLHKIKKGMKEIEVEDFYAGGRITIPLSDELSPAENIERYFSKYKKIKAGRLIREREKNIAAEKLEFYRELKKELDEADNFFDVENIGIRIKSANPGLMKNRNADESRLPARSFLLSNGYRAFVSKSAKDADRMLAKVANGNDFWFHVRDYPGCHVVVKHLKNADLPEWVRNEASNLAVFFSKVKNAEYADVHFTLVKYLHKSGSKSGLVFPTQEKNLRVKFEKAVIEGIFNETNRNEK